MKMLDKALEEELVTLEKTLAENMPCLHCGKPSWALNKNNVCIACSYSVMCCSIGDDSKIFKETGLLPPIEVSKVCKKESCDGCFDIGHCFNHIFRRGRPICGKCDKLVDLFGPIYIIKYAGCRTVFVKCHGEIEVRMFTEFSIEHGKLNFDGLLEGFFKENIKGNKTGDTYMDKFLEMSASEKDGARKRIHKNMTTDKA